MALAIPDLDQIVAAEDLGDTQLGRLELDALDPHDDVEDRVRSLDAGAVGPGLPLMPAPGRVLIGVIGIGAGYVLCAALPRDAERCELIERIDVAADGISVTLHAAGIRSLVAELADQKAPALVASEPLLEAAE